MIGHKFHVYKRVKHPTRKDLWMCVGDPGCNHRSNRIWMLGRQAMCPYCSNPFKITAVKLRKQGLLHCDNCKKGQIGKAASVEETLKDLL